MLPSNQSLDKVFSLGEIGSNLDPQFHHQFSQESPLRKVLGGSHSLMGLSDKQSSSKPVSGSEQTDSADSIGALLFAPLLLEWTTPNIDKTHVFFSVCKTPFPFFHLEPIVKRTYNVEGQRLQRFIGGVLQAAFTLPIGELQRLIDLLQKVKQQRQSEHFSSRLASDRADPMFEPPPGPAGKQKPEAPSGANKSILGTLTEENAKKRGVSETPQSDSELKIAQKVAPGDSDFRAVEMKWLSDHRDQYAGQWVVVEGDQLISHGPTAREVYEEARQAGILIPFIVKVEPKDQLPFGGW